MVLYFLHKYVSLFPAKKLKELTIYKIFKRCFFFQGNDN